MGRRKKKRTRGKEPPVEYVIVSAPDLLWDLGPEMETPSRASGCWSLVKAVLICGLAGGLVGGAIDAALRTDGYALPAALIGGIPAGAIGAAALGWYGWLIGRVNRVRHGGLMGASLGLLGAGALGMIAGLSVWALFWSLPCAIAGAAIHSALPGRGQRSFGVWSFVVAGAAVGIFVKAVRSGPPDVLTDASDGAIVGAVIGVLLIPALLAWLNSLPDIVERPRRDR